MGGLDLPHDRLRNQGISGGSSRSPGDVVRWLGAVQAQDYLGALWAVGLRSVAATQIDVERALADRTIVRSWPMRGTLHFVAAEDLRWILDLTASRMMAATAGRHRQLGLDEETFKRSRAVFERALEGGHSLTRNELYALLDASQIDTQGQRGVHILGRLALEKVICIGPRQGKQQTMVLFDEWVPASTKLARDEAVAELVRRYFVSHGPATVQDFVWWSGLTVADTRAGLAGAGASLAHEEIEARTYWFSSTALHRGDSASQAYLLPAFDEYTVAYRDRSALLPPELRGLANASIGLLTPTMVLDGQVVGRWGRTLRKDAVRVALRPFTSLDAAAQSAFESAARRYAAFVGQPVVVEWAR